MSRPFVFSFVSVNGTRKVLGTREVASDDLDGKLADVEQWLAEKPKSRCATLYGPGMRRCVVTADTRRWLEDMHIIRPTFVRQFPQGAGSNIAEGEPLYYPNGQPTEVGVNTLREVWVAACTVADMKSALKAHGLKTSGVKRALASRLAQAGITP